MMLPVPVPQAAELSAERSNQPEALVTEVKRFLVIVAFDLFDLS
jgi:hypothetical protein